MSRARRVGAAAAVVLALAAGDLVLMNEADDRRQESAARHDALSSARELVPALLSYDYTSLDADLAHARSTTTGKFRGDFDTLIGDVVRPTATRRRVRTNAVVSDAGVVSSTSSGRVTVLVFLTQTSTSAVKKGPTVTVSQVKVVMVKAAGRWLIASLDPV